jgi:DNA-binding NtrC family response regulator
MTDVTRAADSTAGGRQTVLVLDDEDDIREAVQRILSRARYQVLVAIDPADAFALCAHHPGPVHLLVTDVLMPQLPGRDVAQQAVALRPTMRVLYISGYPREVAVADGLVPADALMLEKPFTHASLLEAVESALAVGVQNGG